jgi:DNA polymerase-1
MGETSALLIDANHLLHRVLYTPNLVRLETSTGRKFGGVYGFVSCLKRALDSGLITKCVAAWDGAHSARRVEILPTYKHHDEPRVEGLDPEKDEHMRLFQFSRTYLMMLLPLLGVSSIRLPAREGDDVIFWARQVLFASGCSICGILSEDKDFYQLVEPRTYLHRPISKLTVTMDNFTETVGVPLDRYLLFRAIDGDKSDNITGVPNAGPKTAATIAIGVESLDWDAIRLWCLGQKDWRIKKVGANLSIVKRNFDLMCLGKETFTEEELAAVQEAVIGKPESSIDEAQSMIAQMEFESILQNYTMWTVPFIRLGAR